MTVVTRLLVLACCLVLASCGTGCRGRYSVSIPYTVLRRQPGTIVIFDSGGGSVAHPHVVRVPVKLSTP